MKIMIDTNIFIDVMLNREFFAEDSEKVLLACEKRIVQGFISASCITDIFYIVRKYSHSIEKAYYAVGKIFEIVKIVPVTEKEILMAYKKHDKDFEVCLLSECALSTEADYIITRNIKDFSKSKVMAITPENFLKILR